MKNKLLVLALLLGAFNFSNAQSMGDLTKAANTSTTKAASTAASSFDVASISNQIMGTLSPKLKLTEAQKPAVNSLVNSLLNKKKDILPTAATDKAGYTSKMKAISNTFTSKMKGLVKPEQYTALLGLLPKSSTSTSPLAKMLF